ncbi:MAG: hypothetical protein GKR91_06560 [Pseudomonadales bacterium]|nr:hypothetical protein [Pseudomonadales bacterium]
MSKIALVLLLVFGVTSSLSAQSLSTIIEETILWRVELNSNWSPVELSKLVENETQFEASGNFYKTLSPLKAFGGNVSYVGLLGVEMVPGPNAVIEAAPDEIAAYIEDKYELEFESNEDESAFEVSIREDVRLIIVNHPNFVGASIVIGAYFGP